MLACVNKKMKVRMKNDYKSIALPAELQGHERFCNLILKIIKIFFFVDLYDEKQWLHY
jgi:hypothetical protein